MLDKPRAQRCGDDGGILGFVDEGGVLAVFEGWFDILEEGEWERVALVDVGDVAVESGFGVVIGEEADVLEFPAKDCPPGWIREKTGKGDFCGGRSILSTMKTMDLAVDLPSGSAMYVDKPPIVSTRPWGVPS